jgi:predicted nucleotidyltransferase
MDQRLTEILKELRSHLEALYGNRLVKTVVYGSQARGDARPWSDIDVAVVLKGPVDRYAELHRTGELVAGLSLRFNTVIHCRFVDEESLAKGDRPLLRSILKEGIPV